MGIPNRFNQTWSRSSATLISALNHMFDSSLSQRFAFISEPPSGMIDAMILGSIIAVGAMGFEMGLESGRQWVLSSLLMLMWAGVMLMTMDLGRARLGAVRVDARPLEWTIHGFETAPAPPPDPGPLERPYRFLPSSAAMSLTMRPALRWAPVSWSRVTPQRFIQYSTACRSDRSSRSLSMKPRLSFRPAMPLASRSCAPATQNAP